MEKEGKLPFLDCCVQRTASGSLNTVVYRKPTHTDKYLHFDSHNPTSTKSGVVGCLARRAQKVCTDNASLSVENRHLVKAFEANAYPGRFTWKNIRKAQLPRPPAPKPELKSWARLPYVKGASEAVARVLRQNEIGAAFYAPDTIRKRLVHAKDKLPTSSSSNVVYKVECQDGCDLNYVGKTLRNVGERMKEHGSSVRLKQPEKSSLAKHCVENGHVPKIELPTILTSAPNDMELLTKEAIYLQSLPNLINAQEGHQFTNLRLYTRSLHRFPPRVPANKQAEQHPAPSRTDGAGHSIA
jgi:hypothetical protein